MDAAVVVTYGEWLVYPKFYDETWAKALPWQSRTLARHGLMQAEAVVFAANCWEIVATSEGEGLPVLRWRREC